MLRTDFKIEICANSPESCIAAWRGGADRVELCAGIPEGGTTPSLGMIRAARELADIALNVIIRPRGGDFLYCASEVRQMLYDIAAAKDSGADGIVLGCLDADGRVDRALLDRFMELASPLPVTFHRAFDCCPDKEAALEDIISGGCARILTSGGRPTALLGADVIASLVRKARGRISIMPGCGVNESNIAALALATGAREFHFSARTAVPSAMRCEWPEGLAMGSAEQPLMLTSAERVRATIDELLK